MSEIWRASYNFLYFLFAQNFGSIFKQITEPKEQTRWEDPILIGWISRWQYRKDRRLDRELFWSRKNRLVKVYSTIKLSLYWTEDWGFFWTDLTIISLPMRILKIAEWDLKFSQCQAKFEIHRWGGHFKSFAEFDGTVWPFGNECNEIY